MAQDTVHDLILTSASKPFIGEGKQAWVFDVQKPEFNGYVLRVERHPDERAHNPQDFLRKKLKLSSILTPVDYSYGNTTLAPAVLEGKEGVAFRVRQPGTSLTLLWQKLAASSKLPPFIAEYDAYATVLEKIANVAQASYEDLLRNMNFLTAKGHFIDHIGDNLMLSADTLRWIDIDVPQDFDGQLVQPPKPKNHLANLRTMLVSFQSPFVQLPMGKEPPEITRRIEAARARIDQKLDAAALVVPTPRDERELRQWLRENPIRFEKVKVVENIARLPLSATSQQLRESLNAIEKRLRLNTSVNI